MIKVVSVMTVVIMGLGMIDLIFDRTPAIACTPTRRDSDDSKEKPRPSPSPSPSFVESQPVHRRITAVPAADSNSTS